MTDWSYLCQARPDEDTWEMIIDASNVLWKVESGYSMEAKKPEWCHELPIDCTRLSNFKATFWAGEYYEKAVRPLLSDNAGRDSADRVFEAFLWCGDCVENRVHHDMGLGAESAPRHRPFFSFAPASVDGFLAALSSLLCRFEAMDLPGNALAAGANDWYPSPDVWLAYLGQWADVFAEASAKKAGLLALVE